MQYGNAENVTGGKAGPMHDGSMEAIYWQGGHIGADLGELEIAIL